MRRIALSLIAFSILSAPSAAMAGNACQIGASEADQLIKKVLSGDESQAQDLKLAGSPAAEAKRPPLAANEYTINPVVKDPAGTGSTAERINIVSPSNPNERIGTVTYKIEHGELEMDMNIPKQYQRRGTSGILFNSVMKEHPEVTSIKAMLVEDNAHVYDRLLAEGRTPLEAIKQTPAYKIREKLGYGRIDLDQSVLPIEPGQNPVLVVTKEIPKPSAGAPFANGVNDNNRYFSILSADGQVRNPARAIRSENGKITIEELDARTGSRTMRELTPDEYKAAEGRPSKTSQGVFAGYKNPLADFNESNRYLSIPTENGPALANIQSIETTHSGQRIVKALVYDPASGKDTLVQLTDAQIRGVKLDPEARTHFTGEPLNTAPLVQSKDLQQVEKQKAVLARADEIQAGNASKEMKASVKSLSELCQKDPANCEKAEAKIEQLVGRDTRRAENLIPRAPAGEVPTPTEPIIFKDSRLNHAFDHRADFGITGNSSEDLQKFQQELDNHVKTSDHVINATFEAKDGTTRQMTAYLKQKNVVLVDPKTHELLTAYEMTPENYQSLVTTGKLKSGTAPNGIARAAAAQEADQLGGKLVTFTSKSGNQYSGVVVHEEKDIIFIRDPKTNELNRLKREKIASYHVEAAPASIAKVPVSTPALQESLNPESRAFVEEFQKLSQKGSTGDLNLGAYRSKIEQISKENGHALRFDTESAILYKSRIDAFRQDPSKADQFLDMIASRSMHTEGSARVYDVSIMDQANMKILHLNVHDPVEAKLANGMINLNIEEAAHHVQENGPLPSKLYQLYRQETGAARDMETEVASYLYEIRGASNTEEIWHRYSGRKELQQWIQQNYDKLRAQGIIGDLGTP